MSDQPKKSIYRPRPISGFVEHLPEWRSVEQDWLDKIRATFESFGFAGIETPSVEELAALGTKGEIDKEIFVLERLHADDAATDDARLALHYDLTVPFARYTAQHFNDLVFPFKRYQMQKVWRGERPQLGRSREFMQCDVDVINVDSLPLHFDAEIPLMIHTTLAAIGVKGVRLHISNRKILEGYLTAVGFVDYVSAVRFLDKADKMSLDQIREAMVSANLMARDGHTIDRDHAQKAFELLTIKSSDLSFKDNARSLISKYNLSGDGIDLFNQGLDELAFVMERLKHLPEGDAIADLSIARGFDYYTGTVYEGKFRDKPGTSTVVAGGRYEDLAGSFINKKLPGVGVSLGLTRLFGYMQHFGEIQPGRRSPADVLVVLWNEELREQTEALAGALRRRGIKVEMYHVPQKLSRQMSYAERKNIPFVWFPPQDAGAPHEVKDMASGTQSTADPAGWVP